MARGTIITTTTKDGTKRYRTIIRVNGRQQWRTWDRKKDAENHLDNLSPEIRDGTYREIRKATFKEYVDHYQSTHLIPQMFKPSTYNSYRSIMEHHLLPEFKNYLMAAISVAEINAFTAKLMKMDLKNQTVRNILILLGKIFSKAVSENYLKISPMAGAECPEADKEPKGRALKPDEIQSILRASEGKCRVMIAVAIATGMRRAEQFGLDWESVDFEKNIIKVRRSLYWKFGKYHERAAGNSVTRLFRPNL